jgi:hypothetical protein
MTEKEQIYNHKLDNYKTIKRGTENWKYGMG